MQNKTSILEERSRKTGLVINTARTKVMKINSCSRRKIRVNDADIEEVESFTYLGSVVDTCGGTDADVANRMNKARGAFHSLKKIWSSGSISTSTKLKIFNSNVKAVFLYGAETWRMTVKTARKLQSYVSHCLRRILKIHWTDKITNEELWEWTGQIPMVKQVRKRKWVRFGLAIERTSVLVLKSNIFNHHQKKKIKYIYVAERAWLILISNRYLT